jgi:hypothetical protein
MSLPPLANLFAVYDPDPSASVARLADLRASGEFARISQPVTGWTVAVSPLPGEANGHHVSPAGAAEFVEGADVLCDRLFELCQVADGSPESLARFPGDFGFLRIRADGSAIAVRSCGGLVPFYLTRSGDRMAVATRLGDLVRYLPEEPRLDPLVNAVWASGWSLFPEGRTQLAGVNILGRGHFARLTPGRPIARSCYWDPRPARVARPTPAVAAEHVARLRSLLVAQLERDLDPDGRNLLTLSGGVDSSSLAALTARAVGRRFSTWSLLPEAEERFQHEMSYIEPLVRALGVERTRIVRLRKETHLALLRAAPRVVFYVLHQALCDLPAVLAEGEVRVLFGAEFADEVCGSGFTIPDWALSTSLPRLIAGVGRLPFGRRDVLRWAKHRLLGITGRPKLPFPPGLGAFVKAEVGEEYRAWAAARRRAAGAEPPMKRYLALQAEKDGFVTMNWEAASALGVRRSFPFFNRAVLELAFECHPSELVGPGTKKLLRAALADDVPSRNLFRVDKGHWGENARDLQLELNGPLPPGLETVVRPDWYPIPPPLVDLLTARSLTSLAVFAGALEARRRERPTS